MFKKFLLAGAIALTTLTLNPLPVQAASTTGGSVLCDIFPFIKSIGAFGIGSICEGGAEVPTKVGLAEQAVNVARLAASFIFIGIIVIAVYIVIKAAIKYIRSEGDKDKITEAQKAIKSVFVGLIALFVGVIGLVLILVLFDAATAITAPLPQEGVDKITTDLNN